MYPNRIASYGSQFTAIPKQLHVSTANTVQVSQIQVSYARLHKGTKTFLQATLKILSLNGKFWDSSFK